MRTETVFRESEKPPFEAQFFERSRASLGKKVTVLLRVKLRRILAKGSKCNGKNPTCVQGRARSCRIEFRAQCGMTERAARGEWRHSSQSHGCPRQNPAYRCSAVSEAEMLRFSASEQTNRYGTPYNAVKASKAKAMLAFVFEPSKQNERSEYRCREKAKRKSFAFSLRCLRCIDSAQPASRRVFAFCDTIAP